MPNTPVRAAAEGMPKINRRAFLGTTAAIPAMGMAAILPAEATPVEPAVMRCRRIAEELSEAMDCWMSDLAVGRTGPAPHWTAHIHPLSVSAYPVMFENVGARARWDIHVSLPMSEAIGKHKAAREAFNAACSAADRIALGKEPSKAALRRRQKADNAEDAALVAVAACVPMGKADAKAKAEYLTPFINGGEFQQQHVIALMHSAVAA